MTESLMEGLEDMFGPPPAPEAHTPRAFKPPETIDHGDGTVTIFYIVREENGQPVFGEKRMAKVVDPEFEERIVEVMPQENLATIVPLWAHDGWEIIDTRSNPATKERWFTMKRPKGYVPATGRAAQQIWIR